MRNLQAYEGALKHAAYFHQHNTGLLRVTGQDRVDFLQRQTINDLRLLTIDRSISTVLTSATARILDLLGVVDQGEGLDVITLPGRFSKTLKFLRSRIFFSDQVSVADQSADFAQLILFGAQIKEILNPLELPAPTPDHIHQIEIDNQPITVIGQPVLGTVGYRFLVPITARNTFTNILDRAGAAKLDTDTFEILRVESGQPGSEGELTAAYTPLEIGLGQLISDSKGCYTGQEIIARQITYDKVAKKLVKIQLETLAPTGAVIKVEEKTAGNLTSVAQSPHFGPIGLGVVRRQYAESGTHLSVIGGADIRATTAQVITQWRTA